MGADRDEASPYAAMLAAQDVAEKVKTLGITALHIKLRATGGNRTKTPGPGAQSALRALARLGMKMSHPSQQIPIGKREVEEDADFKCFSLLHTLSNAMRVYYLPLRLLEFVNPIFRELDKFLYTKVLKLWCSYEIVTL